MNSVFSGDKKIAEGDKSFSGTEFGGPAFARPKSRSEIILSDSGTILNKGEKYVKGGR